MTLRKLVYLQGPAETAYELPAEDHRLYVASLWTPDGVGGALKVRSGVVASDNSPYNVVATTGGVNIWTGSAIVQGTVSATQGAYACINDLMTFREAPRASDTAYRKIIVVVRVYDTQYAAAQDGWDIEVLLGDAAASVGAAVDPAIPDNCLVLRRGSVAPSGAVSLTTDLPDYTVPRGGILPVDAADVMPGSYVGQVRMTAFGMQVWSGAAWLAAGHYPLTGNQRRALDTTKVPRGTMIYETDTDLVVRWNGSRWQLVNAQSWYTTGGAIEDWTGTAYKWISALGSKITFPADRIARDWQASVSCNIAGKGWLRLRADVAAGNGKAASSHYYPNATGFKVDNLEASVAFGAAAALQGDQACTFYLEAKASNTTDKPTFYHPHLQLRAFG